MGILGICMLGSGLVSESVPWAGEFVTVSPTIRLGLQCLAVLGT